MSVEQKFTVLKFNESVGATAMMFLQSRAKGFPCTLNQEQAMALLEMIESIDRGQTPLKEIFPHLFGELE